MTGSLTVLHAHDGKRLAKRFRVATIGTVAAEIYDKGATWFSAETVPLADLGELHRLLVALEADRGACIIRGEAAPHVNLARTRKRKVENRGEFVEIPRPWVMLDADGIPLPPGCSVLADPAEAARAVLDILGAYLPELEGVAAVVQFSASAGLDEVAEGEALAGIERAGRWQGVVKRGVSAHVWFWLHRPVGEDELRRWLAPAKAAGLKLTDTIFTVQPHYTAGPVFADGLRDPLAGRRTVFVEGVEAAAEICIPAEPERPRYTTSEGAGTAGVGRGYVGFLEAIGGPDGFRRPILQAISSFVATNWPSPDLDALKADIRARMAAADPGGRSAAELARYASDQHLDDLIRFPMQQEAEKRAAQHAEAERPVAPTFPDRGVPLAAAQRQAGQAVQQFVERLRQGEAPEVLLRLTVGAGKSEAAIVGAADVLAAAHAGGREGALFYLVPRHDLGGEVVQRIAAAHPGRAVAVWRGMDQPDPELPGKAMCQDIELPRLAAAAGLAGTVACAACPLAGDCGYWRQRGQAADIWIAAHNLSYQDKPQGLPPAAVAVLDEAFWPAGLAGTDALHPVQLAVSTLTDERTGPLTGAAQARLIELRAAAYMAVRSMDPGGLSRAVIEQAGFTVASAEEWAKLEWATKPDPDLAIGIGRTAIAERLREAAGQGFNRHRPRLARFFAALLTGTDARSVNAELVLNVELGRGQGTGDVVRFAWRRDFAKWMRDAPKLVLDATTQAEVVRQWIPAIEVVDIEVQTPLQRVRQVADRQFGRAFFAANANNVGRLADLVTVELAEAEGEVLVVAQQAVEAALADELRLRVADDRLPDGGDGMPARLHLVHHGNLTGLDRFREVERIIVVGRPAMNRLAGERLAEVAQGRAADVVIEEGADWPRVPGGIRMADGSGRAVRQPYHPDPLVEGLRWSITEGAVLQAIGRGRGVRRPVQVTLLAELALPLTVAEVLTWDDVVPDRLTVAAAEAAMMGRALPLAARHLVMLRPKPWASEAAAEKALKRAGKGGQTLIIDTHKGLSPFARLKAARYRTGTTGGRWSVALVPLEAGRGALAAQIGLVTAYEEIVAELAACPAQPPVVVPLRAVTLLDRQAALAAQAARLAALDQRLEAVRPPTAWGERVVDWQARQAMARAAWNNAPPAWAPYPVLEDVHR